jgi:hypothetical protein
MRAEHILEAVQRRLDEHQGVAKWHCTHAAIPSRRALTSLHSDLGRV